MTPAKPRKRLRTALRASAGHPEPDGALPLALRALEDAVHALTHPPTTHTHSRYHNLRAALTDARAGHHHTAPGSSLPLWIDALKLAILIDQRTNRITQRPRTIPTPLRLRLLLLERWRPQDCDRLTQISTEIESWNQAVDDLFAVKPIYLTDHRCPQCGQKETNRIADDSERVRTPALAVTAEKGAWCQACHTRWQPDQLVFLGRLLGHHPEGITA